MAFREHDNPAGYIQQADRWIKDHRPEANSNVYQVRKTALLKLYDIVEMQNRALAMLVKSQHEH
jgi:hypothetical protein